MCRRPQLAYGYAPILWNQLFLKRAVGFPSGGLAILENWALLWDQASYPCGLYKFHRTPYISPALLAEKPLVFQSFLTVVPFEALKTMRRCCFFFLAFVAAILLAVLSGSFESGPLKKDLPGDSGLATVVIDGKTSSPEASASETTGVAIPKKLEP